LFLVKLVHKSTNTGLGSTTSAPRGEDIGDKEREVRAGRSQGSRPRPVCFRLSRDYVRDIRTLTLAYTRYCHCQYCMVYCIHKGGRVGVVYCALVVQLYCNSVSNADGGGGQYKDEWIVQESFGANDHLVNANTDLSSRLRPSSSFRGCTHRHRAAFDRC